MYLYEILLKLPAAIYLISALTTFVGIGNGLFRLDNNMPARKMLTVGMIGFAVGITTFVLQPSRSVVASIAGVEMCKVKFTDDHVVEMPCESERYQDVVR